MDLQDLALTSHGARLLARHAPPRGKPLVLFCHGFPGRHFNEPLARALVALGYGALLFRYRGAHGSEGAYAFRHNEEDILVAAAEARARATHGVVLLGYSMGGFHATRVLAAHPTLADALVLQAPVADTRQLRASVTDAVFDEFLASGHDVLRAKPADLVAEARAFPDDEEPVDVAPRIRQPAIVLHGDRDDEVPPDQGRALHAALGSRTKRYVQIAGADHYFLGHEAAMAREIDAFLTQAAGSTTAGTPPATREVRPG